MPRRAAGQVQKMLNLEKGRAQRSKEEDQVILMNATTRVRSHGKTVAVPHMDCFTQNSRLGNSRPFLQIDISNSSGIESRGHYIFTHNPERLLALIMLPICNLDWPLTFQLPFEIL